MPATSTRLGPGTVTIGTGSLDFSCEVSGAKITHEYEETSEARTMLCGTNVPAGQARRDGFSAEIVNDLTAAGLYSYLVQNDLQKATLTFVPNTADGAEWTGDVVLTLPDEIGADEYGAPIASSVAWAGVGTFAFTPGTAGTMGQAPAAAQSN